MLSTKIHIKYYFVKLRLVVLSVLCIPLCCRAAFELTDEGIVALSMANSGCARISGIEGWNCNPACQWFGSGLNLELSTRKLYGLNQLQQNQLSFQWKLKDFGIGAELYNFGWKDYYENVYGLTANAGIYKKIIAGMRLNFYELSITGGGYANTAGFDLGLIYHINRTINYGIVLRNINRPVIGESQEKLPYTVQTGFSLRPNENFNLCLDIFKDDQFDFQYRMGIEYLELKYAVLRIGASLEPVYFAGGLDMRYRFMTIRYTFYNHNQLGLTQVFGIMFNIDTK